MVAVRRLRRVRALLLGAARRQGPVRCSWTVALLIGLFWLL